MFRSLPLSSSRSGRSAARPFGLLLALALLVSPPLRAETYYVAPPPTGSNTLGDGSAGSPYATIQYAYDMTTDQENTIFVAAGTYNECLVLSGFPANQRSVHLIAEAFDPVDPNTRSLTVIDGTGACPVPPPYYSVVNIAGYPSASIEGFTVTGGENGGIWSISSVSITNNVIEGNWSSAGGGLYVYPDNCGYGDVTVTISNNVIRNNAVTYDAQSPTPLTGLGGGVLVGLYPEAYIAPGDPLLGGCRGGAGTIVLENNTVENNEAELDGGGVFATTYIEPGLDVGEARITITQNTIRENTAGAQGAAAYAGGIYAGVLGYGTERIEILNNSVLGNTAAAGYGGGIWTGTFSSYEADHHITVHGNTVTGNTAGVGGGIEVLHRAIDMYPGQTVDIAVTDNRISGNTATLPLSLGAGGGLSVGMFSQRTTGANIDFVISGNSIRSNTADLDGAGVEFRVVAEGADVIEDPLDTQIRTAWATVDFSNNLVALNEAANAAYGDAVGGGALVYLYASGGEPAVPDEPSRATVNMELNTFSDNVSQLGAGGVEVEVYTKPLGGSADGVATLNLDSTIVSDNSGFGIGGPLPGDELGVWTPGDDGVNTAEFMLNVSYSDVFANDTNYEYWVSDRTGQNGNISADPLLDAVGSTYVPEFCSPTVDAANPALDPALEPAPNGDRANMGHTGGTAAARISLADPSGDGAVDGIDVLRIAVAFGSTFGNARWNADADLDGSGIVDGDDLALVAAGFGQACP